MLENEVTRLEESQKAVAEIRVDVLKLLDELRELGEVLRSTIDLLKKKA